MSRTQRLLAGAFAAAALAVGTATPALADFHATSTGPQDFHATSTTPEDFHATGAGPQDFHAT
ncbi:hypothetical protein ABZ958_18330 [Streptomyces sp. NPDC046237]|uniref:hypothetical protein n=1 Tax=Streptomyces sp. NPDC046237 TaxID=3154914 RepID=UPI0033D7850B